uniref:Uncharacterized protein n=1 Tax=Acrobeloides nanus TaxID=290746 RepID=A0A914E3N7_9BILA
IFELSWAAYRRIGELPDGYTPQRTKVYKKLKQV